MFHNERKTTVLINDTKDKNIIMRHFTMYKSCQFSNGIRRLNYLKLFILSLDQQVELKRLINPIIVKTN
ncbi:hypothetical protein H8356DRAFT_1357559 [Neocallimastix lanati (nom. inval.)]|nr:hypothetical protein H8356DRAFT_1357559 [Neocallimastix sp. JGI-2020a]